MLSGALSSVVMVQVLAVFAAWTLQRREDWLRRFLPLLVSLAVGVLLATGVLHLLPEAVAALGNGPTVWMLLGATLMALFVAERVSFLVTGAGVEPDSVAAGDCPDHGQGEHGHSHHAARPANIVAASMLHSFIDGAAVATAFAAGSKIGWLTAFAIALHEIPHRMGDFALFVHLKVAPKRALELALLAGAPSLVGVAAVALVGMAHADRVNWLLPVSAGSFLYIALVNLLPEIRQERSAGRLAAQIASLGVGVGMVMAAGGIFAS